MHTIRSCAFQFKHAARPRATCGRAVSGDGVLCELHESRTRLDGSEVRQAIEKAVLDPEHWLEGVEVPDLDLSRLQAFGGKLPYANLNGTVLDHGILAEALLDGAEMRGGTMLCASLTRASLQGAALHARDLSGAFLDFADLRGADMEGAVLSGAYLFRARLDLDTNLLGARVNQPGEFLNRQYARASDVFRSFSSYYAARADHDASDMAYFQSMECLHLLAATSRTSWVVRLRWFLHKVLWGYGVRPSRTVFWMLGVILFYGAIVYPIIGVEQDGAVSRSVSESFALSLVTFATLGYGNRVPASVGGEVLAGIEALTGAILISAFLVALATKYVRRG